MGFLALCTLLVVSSAMLLATFYAAVSRMTTTAVSTLVQLLSVCPGVAGLLLPVAGLTSHGVDIGEGGE